MTMVQWKNGCDYCLLSYEPILFSKFALQNVLEKVVSYRNNLNAAAGQRQLLRQ